jgi:hypothetical protein
VQLSPAFSVTKFTIVNMIFITQTNFSVSGTQVVQQIGKAEAGLLNK